MKICIYSKAWRSGTGWFIHSLSEELANCGCDILFVCPTSTTEYERPHPRVTRLCPPQELASDAGSLIRILKSLLRVFHAMRYVMMARFSTDLFLVSSPDPLIFSLPMLVLLRLTRATVVYVVHDPVPHAWRLPRYFRFIETMGHLLSYHAVGKLVVLAQAAKDMLVDKFAVSPARVWVIPHVPFSLGDLTKIPDTKRLLLFGTLRRNKCVQEAMKAVVLTREFGLKVCLLVAGEIHNEDADYARLCADTARTCGAAVELRIGYVPHEKLLDLVAISDAFLLPYRDFNSQSGVATLASSNGRPVIATAIGGVREMFADGMPGIPIEEPVTPESISQAIHAFYEKDIMDWDTQARAFCVKHLAADSWPVITSAYLDLFK